MTDPFTRPDKMTVKNLKQSERNRVESALFRRFLATNLIAEIPDKPEQQHLNEIERAKLEDDKRKNRLSKALAAYTVSHLCQVSEREGVASLVDGEEDNGIDAIYLDRSSDEPTIFIVQAKYKPTKPDRDEDIHPFVKGARDLSAGQYHNFSNPLFTNRKDDIEEAIGTPGVRYVLVFVHMGDIVENHALVVLTDFCAEIDATHRDINGQLVYLALLNDESPKEIKADLSVHFHRYTETKPKMAFGLLKVSQLAEIYHREGRALFDQNIRSFIGRSKINEEIEASLRSTPEKFAQYNNGITIMAHKVFRGAGGPGRAVFTVWYAEISRGVVLKEERSF